jgi:hypothetical protein
MLGIELDRELRFLTVLDLFGNVSELLVELQGRRNPVARLSAEQAKNQISKRLGHAHPMLGKGNRWVR